MARKTAGFCARPPPICTYAFELTVESATSGDDLRRPTRAPALSATSLSGRRPD
jgi:hypothetical protein